MKWIVCALFLTLAAAHAHELRPAYLELHEDAPGEFAVLWKTPMRGEMRLSLAPEFSGKSESITPVITRDVGAAALQTWRLRAPELRGQTLRIAGLESTMTDALVRIEFADGTGWTQRLTATAPAAIVPRGTSAWKAETRQVWKPALRRCRSPRARRGSWRSPSGCCTGSASRAR